MMVRIGPEDLIGSDLLSALSRGYRAYNSVFGTSAVDVVGVFDQNGQQLFESARAIKARIKPEAKVMEHPVETGSTTIDHIIFNPIEIELSVLITTDDYRDVYEQINRVYKAATLLTVQTLAATYTNQLIMGLPHDESPDMLTGIALALSLRQVEFATTVTTKLAPRNPKDTTTVDRGVVESTPAPEKKQSVALKWFG